MKGNTCTGRFCNFLVKDNSPFRLNLPQPQRDIAVAICIAVAMCNVAEASQNAYLVLIFYHYPCLKRSDQSYNVAKASQNASLVLVFWHCFCLKHSDQSHIFSRKSPESSPENGGV